MLTRFLQTFAASGTPELPWPGKDLARTISALGLEEADRRETLELLSRWHDEAMLDLPGPALPFHPDAAFWGALMTARAAALIAFRDLDAATVQRLLGAIPLPAAGRPEAHFSADLTLRHWPALLRMARALSEDDPLVTLMRAVAAQVPLSSAGLALGTPAPEHPVLTHAGLRQLLAERALEHHDAPLLDHPVVSALLRDKLGAYAGALGRGLLSPPSPSA